MSTVHVNGRVIEVPDGSSINIMGNKLYVNGLEWEGDDGGDGRLNGVVRVELSGDIKEVKTDSSLHVHGDIKGAVSVGGSVKCENITGHVKAGGSVTCKDVAGSVTAAGSVMRL
jgi:hypothetical protein